MAHALYMGLLTGIGGALIQGFAPWLGVAIGIASGLMWFALEPLIKPRRPLRDPVREDSIAATEEAIRLAERETQTEADRT